MKSGRAEAALMAVTLLWGATFVVVKGALHDASTILFLALRFSLAAVALLVLYWGLLRGIRVRELQAGAVAGTCLFAGYLFQTLGLRLTTAPKSAFLTGLSAVMVPLLTSFVYHHRPRLVELAGVALATAGMGLMTLEGVSWSINRGDLLTVLCAGAFAFHILAVGHYSKRVGFEVLSVTQIGVAALWSLALCGWVEPPFLHYSPQLAGAVLLTGLAATALAFTVMAWAQRHTTATRTALIFTLEPVAAWLTSYLVAGEGLSFAGAAGAALIFGGVMIVEMKPLLPGRHPSE